MQLQRPALTVLPARPRPPGPPAPQQSALHVPRATLLLLVMPSAARTAPWASGPRWRMMQLERPALTVLSARPRPPGPPAPRQNALHVPRATLLLLVMPSAARTAKWASGPRWRMMQLERPALTVPPARPRPPGPPAPQQSAPDVPRATLLLLVMPSAARTAPWASGP